MNIQELRERFYQYPNTYIYGAGVVAFGVYKAIRELFSVTPKKFLVTKQEGQFCQIEGIRVNEIERTKILKTDCLILIAVPEEYHDEIAGKLNRLGLTNYIKVEAELEYGLMGAYLKRIKKIRLVEECRISNSVNSVDICQIRMAVSHKDKCLRGVYEEEPWIRKIQAGAALTEKRITEITDEDCDGLSAQNDLYGELTVTYYVWKQNTHAVTGLFHYRRILDVTEGQLGLLCEGTADVILPLPFVCFPDASGQYGRYLLPEDIETMLEVLKEKEPEHFEETVNILKMPYLYNYNMLIARKSVFDAYCRWLFPLLIEIADRCEQVKRNRKPRYIGRIGEVLTSVYFMRNEKHLRILHGKKVWRI